MKGYVYIISNKAMPDLYKIGYTMKDPKIRAAELSTTGVPHEYIVEYEILIDKPLDTERSSHSKLGKYKEGKEWFRCSPSQAIDAIKSSYGGNVYYEHSFRLDLDKETARRVSEEESKKAIEKIRGKKKELEHEIQNLHDELKSRGENTLETMTKERLKNAKFFSFLASLVPMMIFYTVLDVWIVMMFLSCSVVLYWCSKGSIVNTEKNIFYKAETWQAMKEKFDCKINNKNIQLESLLKQENNLLSSITRHTD